LDRQLLAVGEPNHSIFSYISLYFCLRDFINANEEYNALLALVIAYRDRPLLQFCTLLKNQKFEKTVYTFPLERKSAISTHLHAS